MRKAQKALTERALRQLKPGEWLADAEVPGFGARRHQRGVSFIYRYQHGSKRKILTLGEYETFSRLLRQPADSFQERPKFDARETLERIRGGATLDELSEVVIEGGAPLLTLAEARELARDMRRMTRRGEDPRQSKQASSFREHAEAFLAHGRTKRGRPLRAATVKEYRRALFAYAAPLHGRALAEIKRREVTELLAAVAAERGAVSAMRTRAALSRFYSWAIAQGLTENNPVTGTEGWTTPKRERELSDAELRGLWAATAEPTDFNLIFRLLLWTGARPVEVGSMAWSELDGAVWTFTAERAKNGRPLALLLPRQARDALAKRPRKRELLFGRGANGFRGWSKAKKRLDSRLGLAPWQLRDLRRTVETRLASIGVRQEIINRTLNHAQGPITETYNRHQYPNEKGAVLQAWADALERIVEPGKEPAEVVPLRQAAG